MNLHAIRAIYLFELARTWRTLLQSIATPVISTSLYFVVFGSAIGSSMTEVHGVSYGAFIVPGLIMLALLIVSGYTAINAVVKAELFPVEIRALGVGLPYALTVSLFGGTAEYVALWFKSSGLEQGYYWFVTACIAVSLLVYLFMPETRQTSLIDREARGG